MTCGRSGAGVPVVKRGGTVDYDRPVAPEESRRIARTFGPLYLTTFAT
jgi:hypothetical protein